MHYVEPEVAAEDEQEAGFERASAAHDRLQRFESQMRKFIDAKMTAVFGDKRIERQVPGDIRLAWIEKRQNARHARATALVLAAFVTSTQLACASAEATAPPRPTQTRFHMAAAVPASAIEGRVTIRNVRSVERRGAANSEPYQATIAVLDSAGREVAIVQTDTEGRFRLQLSPGTYILRPRSPGMYPRASEQQVQVRRNIVTQVEIVYDSGKR